MKKMIFLGLLALGFAWNASSSWADSETDEKILLKSCMANAKPACTVWAREGGGGEFPRGLTGGYTTAELAAGETYILTGVIQVIKTAQGQTANLKINLDHYPWLATKARKAFPIYRIEDSISRWKKFDSKEITILVTARNAIWADNSNRYIIETYLEPTAEPIMDTTSPWKTSRASTTETCR